MIQNKGELRFKFGKNWKNFLGSFNDERLLQAEDSLKKSLGLTSLLGKKFLDIGCGSGLFSLAARRLGAELYSFDYDLDSVEATISLKNKFFPEDKMWHIEQGSILDKNYIKKLGQFDIVYSWGVLHHTGNLREALENASMPVNTGGLLFISIYNDQGGASLRWKKIKKFYNSAPAYLKFFPLLYTLFRQWTLTFIKDSIKFGNPLRTWQQYGGERGMSAWHDVLDWVGGYPFEVAKPEDIFNFYRNRGLQLIYLKTETGLGCNEFVFQRES